MPTKRPAKRYRCKYYGLDFPAWTPVTQRPDGVIQGITNAGACWPPVCGAVW
jgi:hypothetical protein